MTQVRNLFYHNYSFIGIFSFVIKAGDTSHTEEIFDKTILYNIKTSQLQSTTGSNEFCTVIDRRKLRIYNTKIIKRRLLLGRIS